MVPAKPSTCTRVFGYLFKLNWIYVILHDHLYPIDECTPKLFCIFKAPFGTQNQNLILRIRGCVSRDNCDPRVTRINADRPRYAPSASERLRVYSADLCAISTRGK